MNIVMACLLAILQTAIAAVLIRNALAVVRPKDKAAPAGEGGTLEPNPTGDSTCAHMEIEEGPSDSWMGVMGETPYSDSAEEQKTEVEDRGVIPDIFKVRRVLSASVKTVS